MPEDRNSEKNIILRQAFGRMINFVPDNNLIFLDETAVNQHQRRNYGYSHKNRKAFKIVKSNKGTNISCIVAIKKSGIIGFKEKDGPFKGNVFTQFINGILIPLFYVP